MKLNLLQRRELLSGWVLSALALTASAGAVSAHDLWIVPGTFRPRLNSPLEIRLRVGDSFPGEPATRNSDRLVDFFVQDPGGKRSPAIELLKPDPAGVARISAPGLHWIAYASKNNLSQLPADKFERYLEERGLEAIQATRAQRGETSVPGKELYHRCLKSIVRVGEGKPEGLSAALGLPLELIPETNPFELTRDRRFTVRVLFGGKPLKGILVQARREEDVAGASPGAEKAPHARTDEEGRVKLVLEGEGHWLIAAVHMVAAEDKRRADWESYWTSLTFDTTRQD